MGLATAAQADARAADTVGEVVAAVDRGDFRQAQSSIDAALAAPGVPADKQRALAFERERMRRIRLDFTLDRAAAMAQLRKSIPDLEEAEFDAWDRAGLIERMNIDGEPRYFKRAIPNLFRLSAEAAARRAPPVKPFSEGPFERLHPHHAEVLAAAAGGATSVAPRRLRVTQSLVVDADAVPAGETVRAWIPYPRAIDGQQEDIRLLGTVPAAREAELWTWSLAPGDRYPAEADAANGPAADATLLPAAEGRALVERLNAWWNRDLPQMARAEDVTVPAEPALGAGPRSARLLVPAGT